MTGKGRCFSLFILSIDKSGINGYNIDEEVTKPTKIVVIEVTKPVKIVVIEVTKPIKIVVIATRYVWLFLWRMQGMLKWITVDEKYLDYLRSNADKRIPRTDYGADKFKPFFGVLFEIGNLYYVTQISHAQPRHAKMKNALDFYKVYIPDNHSQSPDKMVAVVNLNYMFPIPKTLTSDLKYADIGMHRTFVSQSEISQYISLLRNEMAAINKMNLETKAKKVYDLKYSQPEHPVSNRCLDFKMLENYAQAYTP